MKAYSFHTFVSLVFIVLGGLVGVGLLIFSLNPVLCKNCVNTLTQDLTGQYLSRVALISGLSLTALNTLLFSLFYAFNKKSEYQVELSESLEFSVEKKLISQFLKQFFKEHLPEKKPISFTLKANGNDLEVIADFSDIPLEEHEDLVSSLEPKLMQLISKRFGTPNRVALSIFCKKA